MYKAIHLKEEKTANTKSKIRIYLLCVRNIHEFKYICSKANKTKNKMLVLDHK